jgi:hypothetical protein
MSPPVPVESTAEVTQILQPILFRYCQRQVASIVREDAIEFGRGQLAEERCLQDWNTAVECPLQQSPHEHGPSKFLTSHYPCDGYNDVIIKNPESEVNGASNGEVLRASLGTCVDVPVQGIIPP